MNRSILKLGVSLALLAALCSVHAVAADGTATISGVVRDSEGTPQIGAMVELLSANAAVLATTFTDRHGKFLIREIDPGTYKLKAVGTSFLPALRENVKVRTDIVVNMTLTTLFEAVQWLPAQKRTGTDSDDDWIWTLRSSSNRPLLRMLEDGPLVVVTESDSNSPPVMKARLTLSSTDHSFGEVGVGNAFEVTRSKSDHRQLILRANFAGGGSSAFESVTGYRRDLGPGRTMRTVFALEDRPDIIGTPNQVGLQSMVVRSSQTLALSPNFHAEVGNELQAIRLGEMQVANHPFGGAVWSNGENSVGYRLATSRQLQHAEELDGSSATAPLVSNSNGVARVEHGLHQQIAYEHADEGVHVKIAVYHDELTNPVISGGGQVTAADLAQGDVLYDAASGLMRVQGPDFNASGFVGSAKARLFGDTWISFVAADGKALEMAAVAQQVGLDQTLKTIHAQRAQTYAVSVSGKVNRTGTRWRTSYRWQPSESLTEVAPYDSSIPDGFLTIYLRQPIHYGKLFPNGMEALIDVRNLLAEGYRPFITSDGSTLYFAQTERSVQGGLSFTF